MAMLRQMHILQYPVQFVHQATGGKGMEFAPLKLVFQFAAPVQHQAQGA